MLSLLAVPALVASVAALRPRAAFSQQNGRDAQALNRNFAALSAGDACQEGDQACIDGGFAQCVASEFVVTGCAAGVQCFGLPLVNKPGTAIACTTKSDALARIAASGATGGLIGNGSGASAEAETTSAAGSKTCLSEPADDVGEASDEAPDSSAPAVATQTAGASANFRAKNGRQAQADNARFASLTADAPCIDGENACIGDDFAQCANGAFAVTPCAAGTVCRALPLVNKAGTSNTCTTQADTDARIATALSS